VRALPEANLEASSLGDWAYRPRTSPRPTRDERDALERRVNLALSAGRSVAEGFRLTATGGPEPTVRLHARTVDSRRWVGRVLLPAYGPDRWRPVAPAPELEPTAGWRGRRNRPWPCPLRSPESGTSLLDAWLATLTTFTARQSVELDFRPGPSKMRIPSVLEAFLPEATQRPPSAPSSTLSFRVSARGPIREPSDRPFGWSVRIRCSSAVEGPARLDISHFALALERAAEDKGGNGVRFAAPAWPRQRPSGSILLAESELHSMLPGLDFSGSLGAPIDHTGSSVLPFGRTFAGTAVGPRIEKDQGRHAAVLGETGMGKSSLLVALVRHIAREHGVIVLDPLGTTVALVERELPPGLRARVLRVSPVRARVRLNALEGIAAAVTHDPVRADRRLTDLVHSLRRVRTGRYTDATYWGPRLEEMLMRALRAAAAWPDGSLLDAHTLLATRGRLAREVPSEGMAVVQELAQRVRERPEDAEGARRLLHEIVRSPVLETMLCAPVPELRAAEFVHPGRIVLVSGEAPTVGESVARHLLSVYLALIWSEILARHERTKTFLVLDEAQWFAHESLAEMLRLGRFANLHVVLATQSIASLPPGVGESIWTNVADFVAFRGSPEEARELARAGAGVSAEAVLSLPRGHALVMLGKGESVHWLRSLRLPERARDSNSNDAPYTDPRDLLAPDSRDETTDVPAAIVAELLRRAESVPPGHLLWVDLGELRGRLDPTGASVRRVGSQLSEAGAIARIERSVQGTKWALIPERIPDTGTGAGPEAPPGGSDPPQPS
jgi:energy-coupling factor transporter ATP-binding protein EcfA2